MLILGIDDSGRGPVIGPMVLAGCLVDSETEEEFKKLRVRDSKMVAPRMRSYLAKKIKKLARDYHIIKVHPDEIDGRGKDGLNLNQIEAIKAAEIINKLAKSIKKGEEAKVIIDCPSPNRVSWKNYLVGYVKINKKLIISCEHKADKNHVTVSAASILAKTTRDAEIEKLKKKVGKNFGSGYACDPITKEFLKKYFEVHRKDGIFRETWGTVKDYKKKKAQKKIGDF